MEDKRIEIDGVDVSKCEHYNPQGNYSCGGSKKCIERPNCDFKQLTHKVNELNKQYKSLGKRFDIIYDDLMYMNVYQCKKCGHYTMKGYVCHECGTDPTDKKNNNRIFNES